MTESPLPITVAFAPLPDGIAAKTFYLDEFPDERPAALKLLANSGEVFDVGDLGQFKGSGLLRADEPRRHVVLQCFPPRPLPPKTGLTTTITISERTVERAGQHVPERLTRQRR
jgi:hypothetical protein